MTKFLRTLVLAWFATLALFNAHAQKISADPTASTLAGGEYLAGVQSAANVKILPSQILTYSLANLHSVNLQTGTTYTYVTGDRGKLVSHTNASAIAAALPQATSTFGSGWFMFVQNRGAGTLTITPATSTIDGASTLALTTGQGVFVISDGTNYYTMRGIGGGGSGTVTSVAMSVPTFLSVSGSPVTTSGTLAVTLSGTALPVANGGTGSTSPALVAGTNVTITGSWPNQTINSTGGGGSLSNWTEGVNSSTPNVTVPVVSFKATNAATDVDVAIVAKGAGGIAMGIADNASTGGNKRGTNAVDLQPTRSTAAQVASGSTAVAVGNQLTASGDGSVAIGFQSTATNTGAVSIGDGTAASSTNAVAIGGTTARATAASSVTIGGSTGTASGARAVSLGGNNSTASGADTAVIACESCTASQQYAVAIGANSNASSAVGAASIGGIANNADGVNSFAHGSFSAGRGTRNAYTHAGGSFAGSNGDVQYQRVMLMAITSSATPKVLTIDQQTAATTSILLVASGTMTTVEGQINGHNPSNGDSAGWTFKCVLKNISGTVSVVGTCTATSVAADSGASAWAVALSADNTNGGLQVQVTGVASTTLHWMALLNSGQLK